MRHDHRGGGRRSGSRIVLGDYNWSALSTHAPNAARITRENSANRWTICTLSYDSATRCIGCVQQRRHAQGRGGAPPDGSTRGNGACSLRLHLAPASSKTARYTVHGHAHAFEASRSNSSVSLREEMTKNKYCTFGTIYRSSWMYLDRPTCQSRDLFLIHVVGGGEVCKLVGQIGIEHPGIVGVDAERVPAHTAVEVAAGEGSEKRTIPKTQALWATRSTQHYWCWHEHCSMALFRRESG